MVQSFANSEIERVFNGNFSKKLPRDIQPKALEKLQMLDAALELNDLLFPPSNHFKALSGKRRGQYSLRINKQWCVCFGWEEGKALNVEIVDYH